MGRKQKQAFGFGLALAGLWGCNEVPPKCLAIDGRYMIEYQGASADACVPSPIIATVSGGEYGDNFQTEQRTDTEIHTQVNLRGCSMDLKLTVLRKATSTKLYDAYSEVKLDSEQNDRLSGVGHTYIYDDYENLVCQGVYTMRLSRQAALGTETEATGTAVAPTSTLPVAGELATE